MNRKLAWIDLTETYGSPIDFLESIKDEMEADLEKAWKHIQKQKDKTNREYWFMTEWLASIQKHLTGGS